MRRKRSPRRIGKPAPGSTGGSSMARGEVYAFCEPVWAIPLGKWHIRRLTAKGYMLSGGVDTDSLCGRDMGWDLEVPITEFHLENVTCPHCRARFEEIKNG